MLDLAAVLARSEGRDGLSERCGSLVQPAGSHQKQPLVLVIESGFVRLPEQRLHRLERRGRGLQVPRHQVERDVVQIDLAQLGGVAHGRAQKARFADERPGLQRVAQRVGQHGRVVQAEYHAGGVAGHARPVGIAGEPFVGPVVLAAGEIDDSEDVVALDQIVRIVRPLEIVHCQGDVLQGAVVLPEAGVFAGEPVLGQRLVVTVAERLIDRQRPAPPADGPGEERPVVLVPVGQFVAHGRQQRLGGRRIGRREEKLGILHGLCPVRGAVFPVEIVDGHVGTPDARQHLQGVGLLPGREGQGGQQGQQMDRIPQKNRHRSCCMELSAPTGRNRPAAPRSPPPVRIRNPTDRTEGFRTAKVEIFCPTAKITRNICRPKWARTAIQERFSSFCARFSPGLRTFSSAVLHPVARRELRLFPQHHLNNKKGAILRSLLFLVSNVPPRKASPEEGYQYSSSLKKFICIDYQYIMR